ncbi:helix-turn-helix domain-containing protein [Zooshikella harenae]|uniref:Helix-turn-helix transcriptional regulator n=1 Tax=Zooshikella harenae TaxID=2827238 RepID=A0ABS5ZID6_9GAMM|nr:helix-turn-helix transcriptional regulator [Zooshikella harenae]MBU2713725.1 helix-turn-helix transcriptional regulator [Zooshikella harenae]
MKKGLALPSQKRGNLIKQRMCLLGLSVSEVAVYCDVSERTVVRWRHGDPISTDHSILLCEVLVITPTVLNPQLAEENKSVTKSLRGKKLLRLYDTLSLSQQTALLVLLQGLNKE